MFQLLLKHNISFSEDESDEEESDDDSQPDEDAALTYRSIPHVGSVNRIRAQLLPPTAAGPPEPPTAYHVATFSETGKVHIFDIAPHLQSLLSPGSVDATKLAKKPQYTITSHGRAEGFALAWAPPSSSSPSQRLLSGDIHSKIYLSTITESGITPSSQPFTSHTSSVEDIQWSPTESTVFASCSADTSLRVWDVRVKERKSVLAVERAHESDINVLSWNTSTTYLMVTGGDEGGLKVWDLRNMKT
jgi:ribosome assembly protein RRB1